jgi:putative transposase
MIDRRHRLPVVQQCRILGVARSSAYYAPEPVSAADLALMRQIDELHLQYPFAGSRMLRDLLRLNGAAIGRKHVATLMRRMSIEALYHRPRTSTPHPGHKVFPYLLRNRQITAPNQVWAMDISVLQQRRRQLEVDCRKREKLHKRWRRMTLRGLPAGAGLKPPSAA